MGGVLVVRGTTPQGARVNTDNGKRRSVREHSFPGKVVLVDAPLGLHPGPELMVSDQKRLVAPLPAPLKHRTIRVAHS